MTFLELVKALAQETGVELQSKIETTVVAPAAGYGETKEHVGRLVRWTQRAWRDIQNDQPLWNFMKRTGVMPLAEGETTYDIKQIVDASLPAGFEDWQYEELLPWVASFDARYIWMVNGAAEEPQRNFCYYVPPERFFGSISRYNDRNEGLPGRFTFDPGGHIVFDSKPPNDDLYIRFDYRAVQHTLQDDADEPRGLPEKFHDLIVYAAMAKNARFDESGPQIQESRKLYRDMMNKLRLEQLPAYSLPGTYT